MSDNLLECNRMLEAAQKLNQATIAELRADKERLDWLESNRKPIIPCFGLRPPMGSGLPFPFDGFVLDSLADPLPLREAIDAARKEQP